MLQPFAKDNENSIDETVRTYSGMITRIAFGYVKNRADAEDLMQDVFLALLAAPPFDSENHLKHWLVRVTVNKSKNFVKSARKKSGAALAYDIPAERESDAGAVFSELFKLSARDRDALYLHYYEGYSAKEIGGILSMRESAVFVLLGRARKKLKHLLEEE